MPADFANQTQVDLDPVSNDGVCPVIADVTVSHGSFVAVPEPAPLAILGAGIAGIGWVRRRGGLA
jgi:hypothetical protein